MRERVQNHPNPQLCKTRSKIGAVALPLGILVLVVAEIFHPQREDPMDNVAAFTVLQAVDGIALKRAVDAWTSAPAAQQTAAFAAAEAVRWIEIGMNSLSFFLAGLTLFLYGVAIALGTVYPPWVGWIAVVSGAAFMYNGVVVVAYEGFVSSIVKLVGLLLLAVWAFLMTFLMWRNAGRQSGVRRMVASRAGGA